MRYVMNVVVSRTFLAHNHLSVFFVTATSLLSVLAPTSVDPLLRTIDTHLVQVGPKYNPVSAIQKSV